MYSDRVYVRLFFRPLTFVNSLGLQYTDGGRNNTNTCKDYAAFYTCSTGTPPVIEV